MQIKVFRLAKRNFSFVFCTLKKIMILIFAKHNFEQRSYYVFRSKQIKKLPLFLQQQQYIQQYIKKLYVKLQRIFYLNISYHKDLCCYGAFKNKRNEYHFTGCQKTKTCKKENREICWHMVTPKATCVFLMMLRKTLNQVSSYKVVS